MIHFCLSIFCQTARTFLSAFALLIAYSPALLAQDVSFHNQVVPLLTRAGCNSGACHGAAAGRGGMHLSLFGGYPSEDYRTIVQALESRRINRASVSKSLLLRKAIGELDHGGDQAIDPDSIDFYTLRTWIEQGARLDEPAKLVGFKARAFRLSSFEHNYKLKTTVLVEGESSPRDVTRYTQFTTVDPESVQLDIDDDEVLVLRPGRHIVIARYLDRVEPIVLSLSYPGWTEKREAIANNFIDAAVYTRLRELNLPTGSTIPDEAFLRRVFLDLTGRLPGPADIETFHSWSAIDRRAKMVDRLLASAAFNDYWTLIVSRQLHLHSLPNEPEVATAYGDWIRDCIVRGQSWPAMVEALLTTTGDSHSRGAANFARMAGDARAHAELVSEVFLSAKMGCANCHDHPLDRWTQDDYHGLSSLLARIDRGRYVQATASGDVTHPKTRAPAPGRLPGERFVQPTEPPLAVLADWLTHSQQHRLSQAFANRVWKEMFGRGLVDPVDDMRVTNPATHPELLQELATVTISHEYDLRYLLRTIALSATYSRQSSDNFDSYYGSHWSRPMSAHVLSDAIADVIGVPISSSQVRAVQVIDPLMPAPELDALGRCKRTSACEPNSSSRGLAQQMYLVNGGPINQALADPAGRLARRIKEGRKTSEIIQEFYQRAYGQSPSAAELNYWDQKLSHVNEQERRELLEDWLWSMLCSQRFQRNW